MIEARQHFFFTLADRATKNSYLHLGEGLTLGSMLEVVCCTVLFPKKMESFQLAIQGSNMQCVVMIHSNCVNWVSVSARDEKLEQQQEQLFS